MKSLLPSLGVAITSQVTKCPKSAHLTWWAICHCEFLLVLNKFFRFVSFCSHRFCVNLTTVSLIYIMVRISQRKRRGRGNHKQITHMCSSWWCVIISSLRNESLENQFEMTSESNIVVNFRCHFIGSVRSIDVLVSIVFCFFFFAFVQYIYYSHF